MAVKEFTSREEWLKARKEVVTSTDIGGIIGISKWSSRLKVYTDKVATLVMVGDDNEQMLLGRMLQSGIAAAYAVLREERAGEGVTVHPVSPNALAIHPQHLTHGTSLDCFQKIVGREEMEILEVKNTQSFPDEPYDEWVTQVQWQMHVTGCKRATIVALCGGTKLVWWDIDRDEDLIAPMITAADVFWAQYVLPGIPPDSDGSDASVYAVKRLYPNSSPGTEVTLSMEDMDAAIEADALKGQQKALEQAINAKHALIQQHMGPAEVGYLPNGWKVSWKTHERKPYTVKAGTARPFTISKGK